MNGRAQASLAALLQRFFTHRLRKQLGASPHTVVAHRQTWRLLLRYAADRLNRAPSEMALGDLNVSLVSEFLDHLERDRRNGARTRNARLASLRSFYRHVALTEPEHALDCQRVLAIPFKRHERRPVEFLSEDEAAALVAAPALGSWLGRRDRTLLLVALQTGLRNSELTSIRRRDVALGTGAHVRCLGKGRKTRCTPLRPDVATAIASWLLEIDDAPDAPVFPSTRGGPMSPDAVQRLVARHLATAHESCPALKGRAVTPHTLRHTAAMNLLRSGVDLTVIALWLGHESTQTTQQYLHADTELKARALAHATQSGTEPVRFQPSDSLLAFLESL